MRVPDIALPDLTLIDWIETLALSFMISGVFWNAAAGYRLISANVVLPTIILSTILATSLLSYLSVVGRPPL